MHHHHARWRPVRLAVAIAWLSLLCACAALPNPMPSPEAWAQDYIRMLARQDYGGMYAMLSPESRADLEAAGINQADPLADPVNPLKVFIDRHENIYAAFSLQSLTASLDAPVREGDQYRYTCTVMLDSEIFGIITQRMTLRLRPLDGAWVVVWDHSYILEGLEADDTVRLSTISPRRGEILDADSNVYARNRYAHTVYTTRASVEDPASFALEAAQYLRLSTESILRMLNRRAIDDEVPIVLQTWLPGDLDDDLKEKLLAIPGMQFDDSALELVRTYPQRDMTAHLIGYMGYPTAEDLGRLDPERYNADTKIGLTGLERAYEEPLKGWAGREIVILDAQGNRKRVVAAQPRQDGLDLILTLDRDLQHRAVTMLATLSEGERGAVVAMDYTNGDVLALASYPAFDPNIFAYPLDESLSTWLNDPASGNPLYNRATLGAYPPGSTVKPFVAALGLADGRWRMSTEFKGTIVKNQWTPPGYWPYPPLNRISSYGGRPMTMTNALIHSDNIYFGDMALKLGWPALRDLYLQIGVGLNSDVPRDPFAFDLPVVTSKISNTRNYTDDGNMRNLAVTGYGQGETIISPLQMAYVFSELANGGTAMQPRIVRETRRLVDIDYRTVEDFAPEVWIEGSDYLTPETIGTLEPALRRVMTEGTGKNAGEEGVITYAKTGTAQVGAGEELRNIAWFIGYTDPAMGYTRLVCVTMEVDVDQGDMKYDIAKQMLNP